MAQGLNAFSAFVADTDALFGIVRPFAEYAKLNAIDKPESLDQSQDVAPTHPIVPTASRENAALSPLTMPVDDDSLEYAATPQLPDWIDWDPDESKEDDAALAPTPQLSYGKSEETVASVDGDGGQGNLATIAASVESPEQMLAGTTALQEHTEDTIEKESAQTASEETHQQSMSPLHEVDTTVQQSTALDPQMLKAAQDDCVQLSPQQRSRMTSPADNEPGSTASTPLSDAPSELLSPQLLQHTQKRADSAADDGMAASVAQEQDMEATTVDEQDETHLGHIQDIAVASVKANLAGGATGVDDEGPTLPPHDEHQLSPKSSAVLPMVPMPGSNDEPHTKIDKSSLDPLSQHRRDSLVATLPDPAQAQQVSAVNAAPPGATISEGSAENALHTIKSTAKQSARRSSKEVTTGDYTTAASQRPRRETRKLTAEEDVFSHSVFNEKQVAKRQANTDEDDNIEVTHPSKRQRTGSAKKTKKTTSSNASIAAAASGEQLPVDEDQAIEAAAQRLADLRQHIRDQKGKGSTKRKEDIKQVMDVEFWEQGSIGENDVRCVCNTQKKKQAVLIRCTQCNVWQHKACVKAALKDLADSYHCHVCNPWAHRAAIQHLRQTAIL